MVIIQNEKIAGIPVLHVVKAEKRQEKLPFIMFVHGFTSAKEHNLHFGYLLAEAGYRVVLPDALYHGEREQSLTNEKLQLAFWNIVVQTIHEVGQVKQALCAQHLVQEDRIGLAGTSMGGIVTFGSLATYPWIKAAVSLMGSPNYEAFFDAQIEMAKQMRLSIPLSDEQLKKERERLTTYDLSQQPEKLQGRPLMMWHGERDQVVPYHYTYEFYQQIKPLYPNDKLKFISDDEAGHKVTREAFLETVQWFIEHV
ncbi:esterase [Anoxybacteroides amylolyticum]|uniref:Phospholipase/Carboxylesterase family protein n=1 Tax=Anoxybacteroides amylolyticum TaxID=294699 RepID=A0A167TBH0_9BACL|nr:esterase [Anoxybacillus amylolyticus]ANB59900.1 phospholipase/Carboxylesterase family protein [Anoxybacillus amylolyticus]